MDGDKTFHVVVLGAGLAAWRSPNIFKRQRALTVVDRTNHHLFQPLLYQVAACGLSAPDIAQPIRSVLSDRPDITVLLNQVMKFELAQKKCFSKRTLDYDYRVAMGGQTGYFSHPEWEPFAPKPENTRRCAAHPQPHLARV